MKPSKIKTLLSLLSMVLAVSLSDEDVRILDDVEKLLRLQSPDVGEVHFNNILECTKLLLVDKSIWDRFDPDSFKQCVLTSHEKCLYTPDYQNPNIYNVFVDNLIAHLFIKCGFRRNDYKVENEMGFQDGEIKFALINEGGGKIKTVAASEITDGSVIILVLYKLNQ